MGLLVPSMCDDILPCLESGQLHVLSPGFGPGAFERDLGISLASVSEAQVSGKVLAVGVSEQAQQEDLNHDGDYDHRVLHTFMPPGST
jgi:hypothetical protein